MKPKILALYSKSGVDYWRTYQPLEAMRKQGLADVRYVNAREIGKSLGPDAHWADILSLRGIIGVEGASTLRQYQGLGMPVVTDYDDLYFNVSPWNPAYKLFGTDEVKVMDPDTKDEKYLWKDGEEGFDLKANKVKFHSYVNILQNANLITTTTLYLKQAMHEISGAGDKIRVLPNAINLDEWKPIDCRDKYPDKFRFGWAVSGSHGEDWLFIKPVLQKFLASHPDAKFVCIGDTYVDIENTLPKGQVEWHPFSDLWEGHYPMRMAMLGLDVAIAPLADTEFNRCKSPLKWEEYTAFGWPVIAQGMTPYQEHIVHNQTGLLANSEAAWLDCLERMYKDTDLRRKLRFNALVELRNTFDLEKVAHEWCDVYKDLLNGEVKV